MTDEIVSTADEGSELAYASQDAPAGDKPTEQQQEPQERFVPYPALKEERLKRQELARQLEETRMRLEMIERAGQQRLPEPEKELTDDDIYSDVPSAIKGVQSRLKKEMQQELRNLKYGQSEVTAKATYKDYDEVIEHYKKIAASNPHVHKLVDEHVSPAFAAYEIAKRDMRASKAVDPEELERKINDEVAKRVDEALKKTKRELAGEVPPSMESGASAGAMRRPQRAQNVFERTFGKGR